jgi:hypothetical protein
MCPGPCLEQARTSILLKRSNDHVQTNFDPVIGINPMLMMASTVFAAGQTGFEGQPRNQSSG